MTKPKRVSRGATLRLELNLKVFMGFDLMLTAAEVGELFKMLMAEVAREPIPSTASLWVQEAFDRRAEYSRIKGGFGRGRLPSGAREKVYERDDGRCVYCGQPVEFSAFHCDHVEPLKAGGSDHIDNLRTACRPCNLAKAAKPLSEWLH